MAYRRNEAVQRPRRALWALLALVAALGMTLATPPTPSSAVTPVASEPRDRQRLSDPPGAVTLAFSRNVDPSVAKVIVLGPDGKNVTSGALIVEGTNVTSQLSDGLGRGTYTVHYRIDGKSGEPEGGAYQFSYGSGSFSDLPDKSWSGEDQEPEVLRGTNPNGSEAPDPPTSRTPGIEVTSKAATSDPPPPTDKPSTVKAPEGPTTDAASAPASSASPASESGGSGTPWIIGGVLLLAAVAGLGIGVYRNRKGSAAEHD